MIRSRTVLALAKMFEECFVPLTNVGSTMDFVPHADWLHDFFLAREYPRELASYAHLVDSREGMKAMILGLMPDGVLIASILRAGGLPAASEELSDQLLRRCIEDVLEYSKDADTLARPLDHSLQRLRSALSLDGYEVRHGKVVAIEENVFDVAEQAGALVTLYRGLGLEKAEQLEHDIKLTDEHYTNGKWGDCIKHARDVMEHALLGVARARSKEIGKSLPRTALPGPARAFLADNNVITKVEQDFLFALHSLLSIEGGHANMSEQENARISRQYALTAAHFILLRWESMRP